MKANTSWARKLLTAASSLALGISGVVGITSPAHAYTKSVTTTFESDDSSGYTTDAFCGIQWNVWPTGDGNHVAGSDWETGPNWNIGSASAGSQSGKVLRFIKPQSSAAFAGIVLQNRTDGTVLSDGHLTMSLDFMSYSGTSVPVQLKVTDASDGNAIFAQGTSSGTAGTWSNLAFDFANPTSGSYDSSVTYTKIVLVADPTNSNAGAGHQNWDGSASCGQAESTLATTSQLYNADNLAFSVYPAVADLTTTFESDDSSGYTTDAFCGIQWNVWPTGDGNHVAGSDWETGPNWNIGSASAGSQSGKVLRFIKPQSSAAFAGIVLQNRTDGTVLSDGHLTMSLDFMSYSGTSVPVQLKVTDASDGNAIFAQGTSSGTAGTWSNLAFDFANPTSGSYDSSVTYTKIVLVADPTNSNAGAGHQNWDGSASCGQAESTLATTSQLYNADNLAFTLTQVSVPKNNPFVQDFEDGTSYLATGDGNDFGCDPRQTLAQCSAGYESSSIVTDAPNGFGGTKALKIVRGGLEWAGSTFLKSRGNLNLVAPGNLVVTADINAPVSGKTIRIKLENTLNAGVNVSAASTETTVAGWHTYTFDFSSPVEGSFNASNVYDKASVFMNFGAVGAGAGATGSVWYMDNVTFAPAVLSPPAPRTAPGILATFESSDTSGYILGNFGNSTSVIENAPAGGNGGKALTFSYAAGAPFYAGITLFDFSGGTFKLTDSSHKTITMSVYSGAAKSFNIRGKIEVGAAGAVADVTVHKGWQRVTFDFNTDATYNPADQEYTKFSIFPDFVDGVTANKAAALSIAIDDITINGATPPSYGAAPVVGSSTSKKPYVTGTAKSGKKLTAHTGTWSGKATITKTYQWYSCTASKSRAATVPVGCTAINGATGSTFTLTAAQKGTYVSVKVTATNLAGTASYVSKTTSKVK